MPDQYDCVNMSKDQAEFFHSLGFTVYKKSGSYNDDRPSHLWIELEILDIRIPWETTYILPIPPTWTHDYDKIKEKKIE